MSHQELPGWRWGPFTFRLPFYHTRLCWPEFLQGIFVAAATGLALVPVMTTLFGLTFEQAIALSFIHTVLIASAVIVFGEPYAAGWITPALALVLAYVVGFDDPVSRFQAMTALSLNFAFLVFLLGITGMGRQLIVWLPNTLKAGIILGAALAALKRVFVDDIASFLAQPVAISVACAVCLIFTFSLPMQKLKARSRFFFLLGALGLLPGFIAAALIGPLFGEVTYDIRWGFMIPPVRETFALVSPFSIGWPDAQMFIQGIPLALIAYIILFGDLVTGNEVLRDGLKFRKDEKIDINPGRSHLSLSIRNGIMAIVAPFFPTQGSVWTGVHVIIVQRWKLGPKSMNSLHSGLHSYYLMGIPFIFFTLPLLTALQPLLPVALALTLVLTGFACAYIAMSIPTENISRGTVVLIGAALAFFEPWIGLLVGIAATLLLVGWDRNPEPIPLDHD
ncbi:MAG: hypothetical protein LAT61_01550 [Alcanivorax sp.]|nr:hypothetical protein [Alcanivorax sp.]